MSRNPREMSSEDLANIVRTIKTTGITPTHYEQECLDEAADRLDQMDEILDRFINKTMEELNSHYPKDWQNSPNAGQAVCNYTLKGIQETLNYCKENVWER